MNDFQIRIPRPPGKLDKHVWLLLRQLSHCHKERFYDWTLGQLTIKLIISGRIITVPKYKSVFFVGDQCNDFQKPWPNVIEETFGGSLSKRLKVIPVFFLLDELDQTPPFPIQLRSRHQLLFSGQTPLFFQLGHNRLGLPQASIQSSSEEHGSKLRIFPSRLVHQKRGSAICFPLQHGRCEIHSPSRPNRKIRE